VQFQPGNVLWISGYLLPDQSDPIEIDYTASDGESMLKVRIDSLNGELKYGKMLEKERENPFGDYVDLHLLFRQSGFDLFCGSMLIDHLPYRQLWNGVWLGDRQGQSVTVIGPLLLERMSLLAHKDPSLASYTSFNSVGLKFQQFTRMFASFRQVPWSMKLWGWDGRVLLEMVGEKSSTGVNGYELKLRVGMDDSVKMGEQPVSANNSATTILLEFMLNGEHIYVGDKQGNPFI